MSRRRKGIVILLIFTMILTIGGERGYIYATDASAASGLEINDIIFESMTLNNVVNDMGYEDYYSVSISTKSSEVILATYNYEQTDYNNNYKKRFDKAITGTCSCTAIMSVIEYYTRKGYAETVGHDSSKYLFNKIVQYGFSTDACGHMADYGSTYFAKIKDILNEYYDEYQIDLSGTHYTQNLKSTIKNTLDDKRPLIADIVPPSGPAHSVVIAGYYDVTITYKKTASASKKTKTVRYYMINDGFENATTGNQRLNYVRESYVTGVTVLK